MWHTTIATPQGRPMHKQNVYARWNLLPRFTTQCTPRQVESPVTEFWLERRAEDPQ